MKLTSFSIAISSRNSTCNCSRLKKRVPTIAATASNSARTASGAASPWIRARSSASVASVG
jgi:hypothetical protein